jgi:hypothetical protein
MLQHKQLLIRCVVTSPVHTVMIRCCGTCKCYKCVPSFTLTALELFLLHKEINHSTLANKCHWQQHLLQHTAETLRGTFTKLTLIPNSNYLIAPTTVHAHLYMALMCITELCFRLCITWPSLLHEPCYSFTYLHILYIFIYTHTHTHGLKARKQGLNSGKVS